MTSPLLYGRVEDWIGGLVVDGLDSDDLPDDVDLTGTATFEPVLTDEKGGIRVPGMVPRPKWLNVQAVTATYANGRLTHRGLPYVMLLSPSSEINPTNWKWKVSFALKLNGSSITRTSFAFVLPPYDPTAVPPNPGGLNPTIVNLVTVQPIAVPGPGTGVVQGPRGFGVVDVEAVDEGGVSALQFKVASESGPVPIGDPIEIPGGGGVLPDGGVTEQKLASDSVTQAKIAPAAVGNAELDTAAVSTSKLATDAVTAAKVATKAIAKSKLTDDLAAELDGKLAKAVADGSYAPIGSTGATTVDALTDAGAVGKAVAKAPTAAVVRTTIGAVPSRLIPDIANSWWQTVQAYFVNGRVFVGGCGVDGGVRVGWVDLENGVVGRTRLNPERYFQDDHDSVGLAFDTSGVNRRALAVYSAHDDDSYLRLREAEGYNTFESVGPEVQLQFGGGTSVAYGSIMTKPSETNKRVNTTAGSAVLDCVTSTSAPVAHGVVNGMRFRFTTSGAPPPFVTGVSYWVVDSTADATKFSLAATAGGAAIVATATSSDASKVLTDVGRGMVRCRNGGFNKIARTTNLQVSVTERPTNIPPTFDDTTDERFTLIEMAYIAYTEAGNTWWAIATGDPTPVPANGSTKTYFFKGIKGGPGTVRNAAGNIIANLWGAPPAVGKPMIPITGAGPNADMIYDATGDDGRRYYDIARGGDAVAVMSFNRPDYATVIGSDGVAVIADPARAELGGTYKVMRRKTSATTNAWIDETVVPTGKPFGAYKSVYVGGACFERDDTLGNVLLAVVEANNVWTLRRYVRNGPAYPTTVPGTWAEDAILYTAPECYKLGRPKIPLGSEGHAVGKRIFTVSEYSYYDVTSFNAFRGGEIVGYY